MISFPTIIKGTFTGRISAVDGTSFLDACSDVLPYVDGKSIIRLKDSGGKYISAILGAVGTGETLSGVETFPDTPFNSANFTGTHPTNWDVIRGTSYKNVVDMYEGDACAGISNAAGLSGTLNPPLSYLPTVGSLHKYGIYLKTKTGSGGYLIDVGAGNFPTITSTAVWVQTTGYYTAKGLRNIVLYANPTAVADTNQVLMDISYDQVVTAPSTLGCTLLNAVGAQSFISKDAAFTYNAASYTYEIFTTLRIANPRSIMGVNTFRN
jgi:hypothetical protein